MATRAARTLCILALCIATLLMVGQAPARAAPDDLAVIIVNQDYGAQAPAVKYALRDGAAFAKAAVDVLGVPEGRVKTYANRTTGQLRRLLALDGEIAGLLRGRPKGRLFLFYSGHGVPIDGVGYLLPVDVPPEAANRDAFSIPKLREDLLGLIGAEGQVVLFLDACFSGRSGDGGTIVRGASAGGPFNVAGSLARLKRAAVVAAARGDQVAWWDEPLSPSTARSREHGVFTDTLVDALYAASQAGKKELSLADLEGTLARRMADRLGALFPGLGRTQTPDVSAEPGFVIAGLAQERLRDPDLAATEQRRCRSFALEEDPTEIAGFLAVCRTCETTPCGVMLAKRIEDLQGMARACRADRDELARLEKRWPGSRGALTALAKEAECMAVRGEAKAALGRLAADENAVLAKEKVDMEARERSRQEEAVRRKAVEAALVKEKADADARVREQQEEKRRRKAAEGAQAKEKAGAEARERARQEEKHRRKAESEARARNREAGSGATGRQAPSSSGSGSSSFTACIQCCHNMAFGSLCSYFCSTSDSRLGTCLR